MKIFDFNHPSHKPLWLRTAAVTFSLGWAGFEYWYGNTGWALLFAGIGLLAIWGLFINFNPRDDIEDKD